jgi:hypothetical protein
MGVPGLLPSSRALGLVTPVARIRSRTMPSVELSAPMIDALRVLAERHLTVAEDDDRIVVRQTGDTATATIRSEDWGPIARYDLLSIRSSNDDDAEPRRIGLSRRERFQSWLLHRLRGR